MNPFIYLQLNNGKRSGTHWQPCEQGKERKNEGADTETKQYGISMCCDSRLTLADQSVGHSRRHLPLTGVVVLLLLKPIDMHSVKIQQLGQSGTYAIRR